MFESWSHDIERSLLYHITGIFFKYELDRLRNTAYMTHAIVPINWDDLYSEEAKSYVKWQNECMWPYFMLERSEETIRNRKNRYSIFQIWKTSIFYLGQYDRKIIDSDKLFLHIPLPMRSITYNLNTKDFYNMDKDSIFLLILSNVMLFE